MSSRALETAYFLLHNTLETSVDHLARRIYLYGVVTEEAAYRFAVAFNEMDKADGDIHIFLSSPGGDVEAGMAIYDTIKLSRNNVIICGFGAVMSMGVTILQAGDLRLLAPNARVLLHDGRGEASSSLLKMAAAGREAGATVERMADVVAERSKCRRDEVVALMAAETFLSATEALGKGFCDGILVPSKNTEPAPKKARKRSRR